MESLLLDKIDQPSDLKKLNAQQVEKLCAEIRHFMLENISKTGGHLASNLGTVELTVALHRVLETPKDKIVFDVGHQCYTHKLLTGRRKQFDHLRQLDGISGFPNPHESVHDAFIAGHGNTALSLAIGMAWAKKIKHEPGLVVAVIGDGAFTGGMVYEGMNNIGGLDNLLVILNDNKMSIAENVGGMSAYLNKVRTRKEYVEFKGNVEQSLLRIPGIGKELTTILKKSKDSIKQLFVPGMYFEDMGITYIGPIDGHNVPLMVDTLNRAKQLDEPIIIHVVTKKGKGYRPAEQNPAKFHGISPFSLKTGEVLKKSDNPSNTAVFSDTLIKEAKKDKKIVAVTAAMPDGTGLGKFKNHFPDRFFDVGIAEQHAVTFCAGMASRGLKPVFAVYSTFLQRGFDQILHDVAIGNYPVIFGLDRSGLVGADGETHQGIFDIPYLSIIPNMTVMAPINGRELSEMLKHTLHHAKGPTAIKYSRGEASSLYEDQFEELHYGKGQILKEGKEAVIIAVGNIFEEADKAEKILKEEGYEIGLVNPRYIKPFDQELIMKLSQTYDKIMIAEEGVLNGGFGMMVNEFLSEHDYKGEVRCLGIDDQFVEHGSVSELRRMLKIDGESIADSIRQWMKE